MELLKIIKQPADYLPAAIADATQILSERQVTAEEIQIVDQYFLDIDTATRAKKEEKDALKSKMADLFEPILRPSEELEPNKWVNLLLLVIAIQYAWSIFNIIRRLISFSRCFFCRVDTSIVISFSADFLTLLYVPLIFFLVFKRRRWGWILLFADNIFSVILRASQ
jgi:hypothetical protein